MTASELERQADGARALPAQAARVEWRGPHADQFDQRLRQCCADGLELAAAFRRAAAGLEELSVAARQEQRRREQARAWEQQHSPHGLAAIVDNVNDFVFGEDDIPPPPPRAPQPRFLAAPVRSEEPGLLKPHGRAQLISNSLVIPINAWG